MYFIICKPLKAIIGVCPKSGCTSVIITLIKYINEKYGKIYSYENPHNDIKNVDKKYLFLTFNINVISNYPEFKKYAVIRNPYSRLISGFAQRNYHVLKINGTPSELLLNRKIFEADRHHFENQINNPEINNILFNQVFDIKDMNELFYTI